MELDLVYVLWHETTLVYDDTWSTHCWSIYHAPCKQTWIRYKANSVELQWGYDMGFKTSWMNVSNYISYDIAWFIQEEMMFFWWASLSLTSGVFIHVTYLSVDCGLWHNQQSSSARSRKCSMSDRRYSLVERRCIVYDRRYSLSDTSSRLYDRRCSLYDPISSLSSKRRASLQPCGTMRELWNPLLSSQGEEPVDDDLMRATTRGASRLPSWDMEDLLLVSRQSRGPCDLGGPLVERSSSIVEEDENEGEDEEDMDMGESEITGRI